MKLGRYDRGWCEGSTLSEEVCEHVQSGLVSRDVEMMMVDALRSIHESVVAESKICTARRADGTSTDLPRPAECNVAAIRRTDPLSACCRAT